MNDRRTTKLLPCQEMFGMERGGDLIAWVEAATGADLCPCKRGEACPLLALHDPDALRLEHLG